MCSLASDAGSCDLAKLPDFHGRASEPGGQRERMDPPPAEGTGLAAGPTEPATEAPPIELSAADEVAANWVHILVRQLRGDDAPGLEQCREAAAAIRERQPAV